MRSTAGLAALVLVGLATFGNPAAAELTEAQRAEIEALREGDMTKLVLHPEPKKALEAEFHKGEGAGASLADFRGKVLVVNLWATWCPPCLKEMPSLERLRAAVGGDDVEVIAVNMERRGLPKARRWLEEQQLSGLDAYADEDNRLGRGLGVLGLPTTVILDREGREIGRLQGDAEWDSPSAQAVLRALAEATAAGG